MRQIMKSVEYLNITMDDVLQYFFFAVLNESFRNQLVLVTNKTKPSLKDIVDIFFIANERYLAAQPKLKSNKSKSPFMKISKVRTLKLILV